MRIAPRTKKPAAGPIVRTAMSAVGFEESFCHGVRYWEQSVEVSYLPTSSQGFGM